MDPHCAEHVRAHCRALAETAVDVRIDPTALGAVAGGEPPALDPVIHYLEGSPADVAAYVMTLDAINFGSGWFAELPGFGYEHVAARLAQHWRAEGPLSATQLRAIGRAQLAALLDAPAEHELIGLYAEALVELGELLGDRAALDVVRTAGDSAQALASMLAALPMWRDPGFLKRAQIAASDLALAGVAEFIDLSRLTAFADNVLPQVLRHDGVLVLSDALASRIDGRELLPRGRAEAELRACAVHACELLAARWGMTARDVDNLLWTRGQDLGDAAPRPHRTRTTFY